MMPPPDLVWVAEDCTPKNFATREWCSPVLIDNKGRKWTVTLPRGKARGRVVQGEFCVGLTIESAESDVPDTGRAIEIYMEATHLENRGDDGWYPFHHSAQDCAYLYGADVDSVVMPGWPDSDWRVTGTPKLEFWIKTYDFNLSDVSNAVANNFIWDHGVDRFKAKVEAVPSGPPDLVWVVEDCTPETFATREWRSPVLTDQKGRKWSITLPSGRLDYESLILNAECEELKTAGKGRAVWIAQLKSQNIEVNDARDPKVANYDWKAIGCWSNDWSGLNQCSVNRGFYNKTCARAWRVTGTPKLEFWIDVIDFDLYPDTNEQSLNNVIASSSIEWFKKWLAHRGPAAPPRPNTKRVVIPREETSDDDDEVEESEESESSEPAATLAAALDPPSPKRRRIADDAFLVVVDRGDGVARLPKSRLEYRRKLRGKCVHRMHGTRLTDKAKSKIAKEHRAGKPGDNNRCKHHVCVWKS